MAFWWFTFTIPHNCTFLTTFPQYKSILKSRYWPIDMRLAPFQHVQCYLVVPTVVWLRYTKFCYSSGSDIPEAAWSKTCVCGRALAGIAGSNPAGGMDVCLLWVLCVVRKTGLCDGPVTRPKEIYRVWCVWVWSWSLVNEEALVL